MCLRTRFPIKQNDKMMLSIPTPSPSDGTISPRLAAHKVTLQIHSASACLCNILCSPSQKPELNSAALLQVTELQFASVRRDPAHFPLLTRAPFSRGEKSQPSCSKGLLKGLFELSFWQKRLHVIHYWHKVTKLLYNLSNGQWSTAT